ncbi:hypothetical protein [Dyella acidisoli]|uniref:Uncharacterized protein n=1 Tax=Dyella acidisoli TaxID=1867834 RepID=A0ABQ5XKQ6_9GAMM|nr:hypothetical protein [Dyella acidisoli]GLQ91673.1 hypothetical protein GCM10007901_06230 [Dyella acidisoli]
MDTKRGSIGDVSALKKAAKNLFDNDIRVRWATANNVWRTAWALDSILDYLSICKVDGSALGDDALHALDPTCAGNWWDDFGWIGIAALRAAEQQAFPLQGTAFIKIAINAWAYMHGTGWSSSTSNTAVYPFLDDALPGWREFAERPDTQNKKYGAPRVWENIRKTWPSATDEEIAQRKPRYSPGGIWNSPFEGPSQPYLTTTYDGTASYLNPIQNTVSNGLYTILSLRLYMACASKKYKQVFEDSTLDEGACLRAWTGQITWLNSWMMDTPADESLLFDLGMGSVVRERVSTFQSPYWDAAYRKTLAWTGDQGLLMGALRESRAVGFLLPGLPVLEQYVNIMIGTFKNAYAPRSYGQVQGLSLLPWMLIGETGIPGGFPLGDDGDYQTGTGVFMRYLLQLYLAEPARLQPYADLITNSAWQVAMSPLGAPNPPGNCDAFTPYPGDGLSELTVHINRLSVIVMAIALDATGGASA